MDKYILKRKTEETPEEIESPQVKKKKSGQKFLEKYSKEWTCLQASRKEGFAHCNVCNLDFSISHGGRDDCRRHIESDRHISNAKISLNNQTISSFYHTVNDDYDTIRSECLFTRFLIEHNVPISVSDHASKLFSKMFPDSKIAKKYACGRTKTGSIVKSMAENEKKAIINTLQKNIFAIATDASNDIESKKLYPLVVSFYDETKGIIRTTILSLLESSDNTGEGIFKLINEEFTKLNLKWENCIAFSCDNAYVMTGQQKGVVAFMTKEQPNLKIIGCPCHLIHLSAQKATKKLNVDVELFLTQVFYYLQKSSKRKNKLQECQVLCGKEIHKIIKHVSTRWLSLKTVIDRVLEQWDPLAKYFLEVVEKEDINSQCLQIQSFFTSPLTKLNCLFLQNVIGIFTSANLMLQKEQPCIHILKTELDNLYHNLIVRFVKPQSVAKADSAYSINFSKRKYQKDDSELVIGSKTRMYLKDAEISDEDKSNFYDSVREFFVAACKYILEKMPLEDDFLKHAAVADIKFKCEAKYSSILYFLDLFNLNKQDKFDQDKLEQEFALYQCENFTSEITDCERLDYAWHKISKITVNGVLKYPTLPKIMLAILVVPHSNAPTERIFSMIRKNQTEFRSSLGIKTLEALLIEKLSMDTCYSKKFTSDELKAAKNACYKQLNSDMNI